MSARRSPPGWSATRRRERRCASCRRVTPTGAARIWPTACRSSGCRQPPCARCWHWSGITTTCRACWKRARPPPTAASPGRSVCRCCTCWSRPTCVAAWARARLGGWTTSTSSGCRRRTTASGTAAILTGRGQRWSGPRWPVRRPHCSTARWDRASSTTRPAASGPPRKRWPAPTAPAAVSPSWWWCAVRVVRARVPGSPGRCRTTRSCRLTTCAGVWRAGGPTRP
jgi:hypothetical protein